MSEAYTTNNTQSTNSNSMIECFETFIQNNKNKNKNKEQDPLSPKNYNSYNNSLCNILNATNGTCIPFGVEGYRTLSLYKNNNGVYMFSVFLDNKICSYSLIYENENNNSTIESDDKSIKQFESFIKNNDSCFREPLSPKLNKRYKKMYDEIILCKSYSYRIIGTECFRTLLLYKNDNAIYFFNLYTDTIESYCVLQKI